MLGCQRAPRNCERPELSLVAERLANCLAERATAEAVANQLSVWEFENAVLAADLLPSSPTPELILAYRTDPLPYQPQGKVAVLERRGGRWHVIFESPDPQPHESYDGSDTLNGDWWFEFLQLADIDNDGADDVLFQQLWSNITSTSLSYTKMLTAIDDEINVVLVEDNFRDHRPTYQVDGTTIYSQSNFGNGIAMTRTLRLEDEQFVVATETINPAAAAQSVTLPDGTQFVSFDDDCGSFCAHSYGLYRIQHGEQFHYETPFMIRTLKQLRDGNVYIGNDAFLRVNGDLLETPNFPIISRESAWYIADMAMTSQGEIWAAGLYKLLRFGHEQSEVYDLLTHRLFIADDDSVWALGWDGRAESGCCVFHVLDGEVETYLLAEVSAEIATRLNIER